MIDTGKFSLNSTMELSSAQGNIEYEFNKKLSLTFQKNFNTQNGFSFFPVN